MRHEAARKGWVAWRIQTHYKESQGKCFLFGVITSYWWRRAPGLNLQFDRRGPLIAEATNAPTPGKGSISFRKKPIMNIPFSPSSLEI